MKPSTHVHVSTQSTSASSLLVTFMLNISHTLPFPLPLQHQRIKIYSKEGNKTVRHHVIDSEFSNRKERVLDKETRVCYNLAITSWVC